MRLRRGHCIECGSPYEARRIEDGLCQRCESLEPKNDPTPVVKLPVWRLSKPAMRERLGVSGDQDE